MEPNEVTVFKKYDRILCNNLPVDQPEFITLLEREKIIDEETKKIMKMNSNRSKDIRADVIVGEIEKSLPGHEKLDKLLVVMKEFGQGLEILAQKIEKHLDPSMYLSVYSIHVYIHTQVTYVSIYVRTKHLFKYLKHNLLYYIYVW